MQCWLAILNQGDLYELAFKFGLDTRQELDLRIDCKSETHQPPCKEGGLIHRMASALSQPDSGLKLGTSLNHIFDTMMAGVVSGRAFNLPDAVSNCLWTSRGIEGIG